MIQTVYSASVEPKECTHDDTKRVETREAIKSGRSNDLDELRGEASPVTIQRIQIESRQACRTKVEEKRLSHGVQNTDLPILEIDKSSKEGSEKRLDPKLQIQNG